VLMFEHNYVYKGMENRPVDVADALSQVMDPHDYHDQTDLLNDKMSQIRSVIGQLVANLHAQGVLTDDFVESLVSPHFRKVQK